MTTSHNKTALFLEQYFADTLVLYFKTHSFHWNVTGANFFSLHKLFEEHYSELQDSIDEIAERIRSLGVIAPFSMAQATQLSTIKEMNHLVSTQDMLKTLISDHQTVCGNLKDWIESCEGTRDFATQDFFVQRLEYHEKAIWMLSASIDK